MGREILEAIKDDDTHLKEKILVKIEKELSSLINLNLAEAVTQEGLAELVKEFVTIIPFDQESQENLVKELMKILSPEGVQDFLLKIAKDVYSAKENQLGPAMIRQVEKLVTLDTIDTLWMEHLDAIDDLREGIGLRGYGQKDPLVEYKAEAYNLFERLMSSIDYEITHRIYKVQPTVETPQPKKQQIITNQATANAAKTSNQNPSNNKINPQSKTGRNDPCPCGSGKKFKKCHGA